MFLGCAAALLQSSFRADPVLRYRGSDRSNAKKSARSGMWTCRTLPVAFQVGLVEKTQGAVSHRTTAKGVAVLVRRCRSG